MIFNKAHKLRQVDWGVPFGVASIIFSSFVFLLLVCMQQWLIAGLLVAGVCIILLSYICINKPEAFLIVSLFCSIIPFRLGLSLSHWIILSAYPIFVIYHIAKRSFAFRFDITSIAWIILILLGLVTIGKWHDYKMGVKCLIHLAIVPFIVYSYVNHSVLSVTTIRKVILSGVTSLSVFLVIASMIAIVMEITSGVSVNTNNIMSLHSLMVLNTPSNRLAGLLVFLSVFIFTAILPLTMNHAKRVFYYLLVIFALLISMLIVSRGAFVALAAAVGVYIGGQFIFNKKLRLLPILISVPLVLLMIKPFIDMVVFRMSIMQVDQASIVRQIVWWDASQQILRNILVGSGPGQYQYNVFYLKTYDPHNIFLRYGVEFGASGAFILFFILFYQIKRLFALMKYNPGDFGIIFMMFMPAIAAAFIHSQIDIIITSEGYGLIFWIVWALMVRMISDIKKGDKPSVSQYSKSVPA